MDVGRPAAVHSPAPLRLLLAATLISAVGTQMSVVSVPWFVIATTGHVRDTAFSGFALILPLTFAGLVAGRQAAVWGPRRTAIVADAAAAVLTAVVPAAHAAGCLPLAALLPLLFVTGFVAISGTYAARTLVPTVAGAAGKRLEDANSLYFGGQRAAVVCGPAIAAVLLPVLRPPGLLVFDAMTFAASALLISRTPAPPAGGGGARRAGWLDGLRWLLQKKAMAQLAAASALVNSAVRLMTIVLLPLIAHEVLRSDRALGVMVTAFGLGLLLAAGASGRITRVVEARVVLVGAQALMAVGAVLLLPRPSLVVTTCAAAVMGLGGGLTAPILFSLVDRLAPADRHAQVAGAWQWASALGSPFAVLVVGVIPAAHSRAPLTALVVALIIVAALSTATAVTRLHDLSS